MFTRIYKTIQLSKVRRAQFVQAKKMRGVLSVNNKRSQMTKIVK